jgi:hypothetical protein
MESRPMLLSETLFYRGQALGKIQQDVLAGEVRFIPKHGPSRLAGRSWKSVNACKKAVIKTYQGEMKW